MKVADHNKFRLFDYDNHPNPNFELGQVVINKDRHDESDGNPIGVVIQLHDDGDCRTDMYGNVCPSEVRLATLEEITKYRNDIVNDLI